LPRDYFKNVSSAIHPSLLTKQKFMTSIEEPQRANDASHHIILAEGVSQRADAIMALIVPFTSVSNLVH